MGRCCTGIGVWRKPKPFPTATTWRSVAVKSSCASPSPTAHQPTSASSGSRTSRMRLRRRSPSTTRPFRTVRSTSCHLPPSSRPVRREQVQARPGGPRMAADGACRSADQSGGKVALYEVTMANLVIGHVSQASARVWVRGDKKSKSAKLRYRTKGVGAWSTQMAPLEEHRGFIAVIDLPGLTPDTAYECDLSYQGGGAPPVR